MPAQRLQKIIAAAGIASRRKAEQLIAGGLVSLNGQIVTEPGTKADPLCKKAIPLPGDVGCISRLIPSSWPLVPKLQLGHALVCEARLRPRRARM